jgi:hypothetical protein
MNGNNTEAYEHMKGETATVFGYQLQVRPKEREFQNN